MRLAKPIAPRNDSLSETLRPRRKALGSLRNEGVLHPRARGSLIEPAPGDSMVQAAPRGKADKSAREWADCLCVTVALPAANLRETSRNPVLPRLDCRQVADPEPH